MTTETFQYRGYDIVPMWQWSLKLVYRRIFDTRPESCPLLSQLLCVPSSRKDVGRCTGSSTASTKISIRVNQRTFATSFA